MYVKSYLCSIISLWKCAVLENFLYNFVTPYLISSNAESFMQRNLGAKYIKMNLPRGDGIEGRDG